MVVGLILFARLGLNTTYVSLLPGFMLFGAGAGLMNVPLTNAVMQAIPQSRAGVASARLNASREVAGLLGVTVIGAVLSTRQSAALAELTTVDELAADLLAPGEMTRWANETKRRPRLAPGMTRSRPGLARS